MLDGSNTFVWIASGNTAKKCVVTTGEVSDQGVTITSGLQEGTQVIVGGQNKVSEGTKIKVSWNDGESDGDAASVCRRTNR